MTTYLHAKAAGTPTWLDLSTTDIEGARAFYQSIFGWEYDIGGPEFGGYTIARLGKYPVAGLMQNPPDMAALPSAWGLYFASDNVESDVARAVELGAKVLYPSMQVSDFGAMATCTDPGGAMFSFWQANKHIGAEVDEIPGSAAWYELYTLDLQQARNFYSALLGASAEAMPGGMEYYVLRHDQKELAGMMPIDPSWGDFSPQWATYFAVENADATATAITSQGGKLLSKLEDTPFGRLAAVADPYGATFKIIQAPAS